MKENASVEKIIIFGSSITDRCHIDSDVDVYVQLSDPVPISFAACDFVYDLWTNYTVDQRLLSEILSKGVVVYVSKEDKKQNSEFYVSKEDEKAKF